MENLPTEVLAAVANLGVGAIFLWLFILERKSSQEARDKKDELHDKVLEAFNRNTEVNAKTNQAMENNTEATKTLSDLVYELLKEKRQ